MVQCCGATSILNGQWLMVTFVGLGVQKKIKRFQWCRWVNSPLSTHWRGCNGPAADSDWPFIGFGKRQCAFHSLFRLFQLLLGKSTQLKAYFYVWPDCWFDSSKESNLVFTVPKFLPFFCFIRFRMTHFKFSPIGRTNFKIENIHNYCMLCSRYNDMSPTNCNVCIAQCNPRYQNKTLRSILLLWY